MKDTICDAREIWKQFEDLLVPRLGLSAVDRAAYSYLLRHSRIEGKVQLRFSIAWLARGIGLCKQSARNAVRRLVKQGAVRLLTRTKDGHVVDVRLPEEIPGIHAQGKQEGLPAAAGKPGGVNGERGGDRGRDKPLPNIDPSNIEEIDFMQTRALRLAIHARERGRCFYCLRRLTSAMQGLDHVVPRAQSGSNSYRNLVSCWLECNSQKGETPAGDWVRWLFREGRLTAVELTDRLRALEALASGKLVPPLVEPGGIYPDPVGSPASSPPTIETHGGHLGPSFSTASSHPRICGEPAGPSATASTASASASTTTLAEIERITILRVFEQARGDKALAGKMLGISRATLYRKLKRYNIPLKGSDDGGDAEPLSRRSAQPSHEAGSGNESALSAETAAFQGETWEPS